MMRLNKVLKAKSKGPSPQTSQTSRAGFPSSLSVVQLPGQNTFLACCQAFVITDRAISHLNTHCQLICACSCGSGPFNASAGLGA